MADLGARRLDLRRLARRTVRHPRPVTARGVRRRAPYSALIEPQRLGALAPGIAAIDDQARPAASPLSIDGREHDIGAAAGFREPSVVAHQRDAPRPFAPSAQTGLAAEAQRLLFRARQPLLRAVLAAAPCPGVGDETV